MWDKILDFLGLKPTIKEHHLPRDKSMGELLFEFGTRNVIRGNVNGSYGIDWVILRSPERIDAEITLLQGSIYELLTLRSIIQGTPNATQISIISQRSEVYFLLSARYQGGEIVVDCNIAKGADCERKDLPVSDLRRQLTGRE